ncbi:CocE/NonD family hydrolase [Chryseobacterium sp.]|uniref:CocE/NonD family hydrolase n=1 Tax=Chryseobacterium sp. TaxID=1871047 RepID=UPI0025B816B5|nr:CocE/NonD family hydrolase [Chryseobacterium sp.]
MNKTIFIFNLFLGLNFIIAQNKDVRKSLKKENLIVYDSINIQTKKNISLTLSLIYNNFGSEPKSTILINTIYADVNNVVLGKSFAKNGYAVVILNTRGKYLSNNILDPFEHEAEDINEAINWIIKQPWSDGKVGMIGHSYSGFSQWAATKRLHPALKTIIPQAAVAPGIDFPMRNNMFFTYILSWLNRVSNHKMTDNADFNNGKKWYSIYKKWYESGVSFRKLDSISGKPNAIFQKWLDHPSYDSYWKTMIPYKDDFSNIDIPVLTTTGYYDADQLGALYYLKEHYSYNKNAEHYMVIGPYDHQSVDRMIKTSFRGYTIDPAARIDFEQLYLEWFNYVLKNKEKPALLKDKINYQLMGSNEWKSKSSISDLDRDGMKWFFNHEKDVFLLTAKPDKKSFSRLTVDLKDRSDSNELLNLKYNIVDKEIYLKNNLIFTTAPFDQSFDFSGQFSGELNFSVNKRDVDLYFSLYEKTVDNKYFLLSTCVTRASYAKNREQRNLLALGKKESIPIQNSEFVSKRIKKGSRLILMIGITKSPFWQINYGTGGDISNETIKDAQDPVDLKIYGNSYINIPLDID